MVVIVSKVVLFEQKCFIPAKWLYSGKGGCIRAKEFCIRANYLYSGKSNCIRAKLFCNRAKVVVIRAKVVVF